MIPVFPSSIGMAGIIAHGRAASGERRAGLSEHPLAATRSPLASHRVRIFAMKRAFAAALILVTAVTAFADKRAFTIEDLYRAKTISELALSPDGKTIAFTLATPDLARGKRTSRIWLIDADGQNARQLTQ